MEGSMRSFDQQRGYYRQREQQEREIAISAKDGAAKQVHLALDEKYRRLADGNNLMP
jgi:hypothetical protein